MSIVGQLKSFHLKHDLGAASRVLLGESSNIIWKEYDGDIELLH